VTESAPDPVVEEPVIEELTEARKVEEHAAELEVAPVVASSNVEVGTTLIGSGSECLKCLTTPFQEEPAEDSVVEVAKVPSPAANEDCNPGKGLVEPVEESPEVVISEVHRVIHRHIRIG